MENRPIRSPHENANGSSARRRSNPATCNNQNSSTSSNVPPQPPPSSSGPPPPVSRPVRANLLAANGRGSSEDERERRRSIVDPDLNFEKFLLRDQQADPSSLLASPPKSPRELDKIRPPPLRPQHVYAPMPALGALSFLGKKSGDMNETDFSRLMNGKLGFI